MKRFSLIHLDNDDITDFQSRTARDAALKAASRDEKFIVLVENQKFHIFEGMKRALSESEETDFTKSKNITNKPIVRKMGSNRVDTPFDLKKKQDLEFIKNEVRNFTNQL